MFCVKCGIIIKEGQKFCTNCGAPVYKTTVNANQNDVSDKESEEKSKDVQNRDSIQFEDFKKQSAEYLNEKGTVFFNTVKDKANILLKNCNEFIKSKKPVIQEILKDKKKRNKVLIAVVCVVIIILLICGIKNARRNLNENEKSTKLPMYHNLSIEIMPCEYSINLQGGA